MQLHEGADQLEVSTVEVHPEDEERVMDLLQEHVPLSLLVDLTDTSGPGSDEILVTEGEPEDHWWESPDS